jgi:hypothetical protein
VTERGRVRHAGQRYGEVFTEHGSAGCSTRSMDECTIQEIVLREIEAGVG